MLCVKACPSQENHSRPLHKRKRLQLFDIVGPELSDAEFAFLSACHTAQLTEECLADEVLHLTAAMQFRRFWSGVGTLWAMADMNC
jgi:CHAT domain-containing protein